MKRFNDKCNSCFCPRYEFNDKCKCGCHHALAFMIEQTGMTLDDVKTMCNKLTNNIEKDPFSIQALRYELWKLKHGKYTNAEMQKHK
jgi:hypothetical protein